MLTPFAPHTCEELWGMMGKTPFISTQNWPEPDESLIDEKIEQQEESVRNAIKDMKSILDLVEKEPEKIYLYVIPPELEYYKSSKELFQKDFKQELIIQSSAIPKYDPENKAKRAKFGKPGIYVE
jgi:leucyl-tRNA synthetase